MDVAPNRYGGRLHRLCAGVPHHSGNNETLCAVRDNVVNTQATPRYGTNGRENAPALVEEAFMPDLEKIAGLLFRERGGRLSPVLQTRMALALIEVAELINATNDLFMFGVYSSAAHESLELGDPMAIGFCFKMFQHSVKAGGGDGLSASQSQMLEHVRSAGIDALRQAARLCGLLYGEEHNESIRLRKFAEAAVRRKADAS